MEIKSFSTHGRKLLVEFKCYRCRKTATKPLEECINQSKECCFRDLYDLSPPKEWQDGGFYYPLFCPDCKKAYDEFMNPRECENE